MKRILSIFLFVLISMSLFAQESTQAIPSVDIRALNGTSFNTSNMSNDGKPYIISFWATWCKPCVQELTAIADVYDDWQEETGVKLYAISVDDAKTIGRVNPFVNSKGWEFEFYLDQNGDFKRAMNVINVPHTFIIDGEGKVVYQHTSYAMGDEDRLYEKIKELIK